MAALAVNDHLLKARFPGWWTGKASDFAGVAVVAVLASVVVGPRLGLVLTAAAFVALETVPGVAQMASPVLGGVARRDPGDLIALATLLPLWFVLQPQRAHRTSGRPVIPPSSGIPSDRHQTWALTRTAVSLVGAILAVATATATSCGYEPAVVQVATDGTTLHALIDNGYADYQWARSEDGGSTWQYSSAPPGSTAGSEDRDRSAHVELGPSEACTHDTTCWRVRDHRFIERRVGADDWVVELQLTDEEVSELSDQCIPAGRGVLESIAATNTPEGTTAIASLGTGGSVVRQQDGTWERRGVLEASPAEPVRYQGQVLLGLFLIGLLPPLMVLSGRRWLPRWKRGLGVAGAGWAITCGVTLMIATPFMVLGTDRGSDVLRVVAFTALTGFSITAVAALVVARRRPPPPVLPPPPAPPTLPPPPSPSPPGPSSPDPPPPGPPPSGPTLTPSNRPSRPV